MSKWARKRALEKGLVSDDFFKECDRSLEHGLGAAACSGDLSSLQELWRSNYYVASLVLFVSNVGMLLRISDFIKVNHPSLALDKSYLRLGIMGSLFEYFDLSSPMDHGHGMDLSGLQRLCFVGGSLRDDVLRGKQGPYGLLDLYYLHVAIDKPIDISSLPALKVIVEQIFWWTLFDFDGGRLSLVGAVTGSNSHHNVRNGLPIFPEEVVDELRIMARAYDRGMADFFEWVPDELMYQGVCVDLLDQKLSCLVGS